MTLDVVLKDIDITTSVNYASFVQSHRVEVIILIELKGFIMHIDTHI